MFRLVSKVILSDWKSSSMSYKCFFGHFNCWYFNQDSTCKLKNTCHLFPEFYHEATYNLTELVSSFYVQTEYVVEGTPFSVFWYDSVKTDHSKEFVNIRKKFLQYNLKDWTVQVNFITKRSKNTYSYTQMSRLQTNNKNIIIIIDIQLHHILVEYYKRMIAILCNCWSLFLMFADSKLCFALGIVTVLHCYLVDCIQPNI